MIREYRLQPILLQTLTHPLLQRKDNETFCYNIFMNLIILYKKLSQICLDQAMDFISLFHKMPRLCVKRKTLMAQPRTRTSTVNALRARLILFGWIFDAKMAHSCRWGLSSCVEDSSSKIAVLSTTFLKIILWRTKNTSIWLSSYNNENICTSSFNNKINLNRINIFIIKLCLGVVNHLL